MILFGCSLYLLSLLEKRNKLNPKKKSSWARYMYYIVHQLGFGTQARSIWFERPNVVRRNKTSLLLITEGAPNKNLVKLYVGAKIKRPRQAYVSQVVRVQTVGHWVSFYNNMQRTRCKNKSQRIYKMQSTRQVSDRTDLLYLVKYFTPDWTV